MLLPIKRFLQVPVMSIQTGTQLAQTSGVIVDPRTLTVVAFLVSHNMESREQTILYPEDIREQSNIGMIVDSSDSLMTLDGLVRLQEIIDFDFELVGTVVENESGKRLGKVFDYAIDGDTFSIQQIYTKPTLLKSISSTGLTIHRSQVVTVTNERLVVKDATIKDEARQPATSRSFVNPFRSPTPGQQPETYSSRS